MVFKRRRFFRRRPKKATMKKKVNQLARTVSQIRQAELCEILATGVSMAQTFTTTLAGAAITDVSLMSSGAAYFTYLTTLSAGVGLQQRSKPVVHFRELEGTLRFQFKPIATFAVSGVVDVRCMILWERQALTDNAGVYAEPTFREALTTSNTLSPNDIDANLAIVQLNQKPRQRNYRIVYDKRFQMAVAGERVAKVLRYKIRPPKNQHTTYLGNTNTSVDCIENHYILYVFQNHPAAVAGVIPASDQLQLHHYACQRYWEI